MRISVITPSKNQGRFIRACLESVHNQTHREVEHIVLDGVSTDETAEVVEGYPCHFDQRKDSGPAQAINRGLEMATGEIVCWLNADDAFFSPEVLKRVAELFEKMPGVHVITGDGYYISESGSFLEPIRPDRAAHMSRAWIQRSDVFLQPATFWRRNSVRLREDLKYTFDWQYWLDLYEAGLEFLYIPEYFALYRLQPVSLTQQGSARRKKEIYEIVARNRRARTQAVWCWFVWRIFAVAERTGIRAISRAVNKFDSFLNLATNGRIRSG